MEFAEFISTLEIRPAEVSRAIGVHASTIIRLRDKTQHPDGRTLLKLNRWAEDERRRRRLPVAYRLDWQWVLDDEAA